MNRALTPVTIIAGFLGAGKTTLINRILEGDHGLKITVLVNDFGAINIDADLILRREREVMELSNGCICCSIQGDLVAQLQRLFLSDAPPEYLLIEASGVSQPGRISAVFGYPQLRDYARLDAVITLLDVVNIATLSDACTSLVQSQLEAADIVVLTKTDLVDKAAVAVVRKDWLFPDLPVIEAEYGKIPVEMLLDTGRHKLTNQPQTEHQHSLEFCSFSWHSDQPVSYAAFKTALSNLPVNLYRAKGFLFCEEWPDQRIVFQKVGSRVSFMKDREWTGSRSSKIVGIGERGYMDHDVFQAAIDTAVRKKPTPMP